MPLQATLALVSYEMYHFIKECITESNEYLNHLNCTSLFHGGSHKGD